MFSLGKCFRTINLWYWIIFCKTSMEMKIFFPQKAGSALLLSYDRWVNQLWASTMDTWEINHNIVDALDSCQIAHPVHMAIVSLIVPLYDWHIITWLCDILALVWHFGPACVTFRPGLCDILALSCVTKASACHHTPILTTGAVYRKFHRSSVSKTT